MRRQIVEQRALRPRDAVRETRRAAAVLEIAGLVGLLLGERRDGGGACRELAPVDRLHLALLGGLDRHGGDFGRKEQHRSEEHTSELQSLMRISYAVFCLKKKRTQHNKNKHRIQE